MTAVDRYLLSTDHLADVVVDIARVLTARPVAGAADREAMERLRNHPAVRKLAGARPLPGTGVRRPYRRRARPRPDGLDEFGDPAPDEGNAA